ncbi:MAG: hypothetical protein ACFB01_13720 [Cohaesibacteraceae bacterium]
MHIVIHDKCAQIGHVIHTKTRSVRAIGVGSDPQALKQISLNKALVIARQLHAVSMPYLRM